MSWAEIGYVPIHGNVIDVRHNGRTETVLTNRSGKAITWIAKFYGTGRIEADAKAIDTRVGKDDAGEPLVWAEVPVAAGESRKPPGGSPRNPRSCPTATASDQSGREAVAAFTLPPADGVPLTCSVALFLAVNSQQRR